MFKVQTKGLEETLGYIDALANRADDRLDTLIKRLADIGVDTAKMHFSNWSLYISNDSPVNVYAESMKDGIAIVADGERVAFIEFGAGVYYNGAESYLGERPSNVAGIGEYGQGKGKQNTWAYYDANHVLTFTHGNPPANAMYFTSEEIIKNIDRIAKEVFSDD